MKKIYKYGPMYIGLETQMPVPAFANIIHVANQKGEIHFWAEVDEQDINCPTRIFKVVGTGQSYSDEYVPLGTVQDSLGFVWHLLGKTK